MTLWLVTVLAGCNGPVYTNNGSAIPGGVPSRGNWTVSGGLQDLQAIADGNINTAATTARPPEPGTSLTIDFGKVSMFNFVAIDHGLSPEGYVGQLAIMTSVDGRNYKLRHVTPGTRRVTTLSLVQPVMTQYVRLVVREPGRRRWSVAEIYFQ